MGISKETFTFLRSLAKHNTREWFDEHKDEYKQLHGAFKEFAEGIADEIATFDPEVKASRNHSKTVKVFRIYRDVRFSKDKSPYKVNFGVTVSPKGMESGSPGYYIHVQPGNASFVGGGMHWVMPLQLKRLRNAIVRDNSEMRKLLRAAAFKKAYGGGLSDYNALKTIPHGYPKDHPDADLLRLKSFTAFSELKDTAVASAQFSKKAIEMCRALLPLNNYLRDITQGK